jgi:hypothetical protein
LSTNVNVSHLAAAAALEAAADVVSDTRTACNAAESAAHLHPDAVEASDAEIAAAAATDAEDSANPTPADSQLVQPSSLDMFCRFRCCPSPLDWISRAAHVLQR